MAEDKDDKTGAMPGLEDLQHWTWILGRAQQMMMEAGLPLAPNMGGGMAGTPAEGKSPFPQLDPAAVMRAQAALWADSMALWQRFLDPNNAAETPAHLAKPDKRFKGEEWQANPIFDFIRQAYLILSDHMLKGAEAVGGLDPKMQQQMRFAAQTAVDAMAPSNFAFTNPEVIKKTIESNGQNLLTGMERMLNDIKKGQLSHVEEGMFEVGRNIATTPGKVVKETPLYQLIQYKPATESVLEIPLIIFPPWINRFYILDLTPEKSFIKWCVDQGITVFMVSWKSADASMKDVIWDDYILKGQVDAIDTVRDLLDVPAVHTIGYCVAGTTLAATLALLAARGEADKVASATFFTAQVDFEKAGELLLFVDDDQLKTIENLSGQGFLDGRYMALTFNLLRGRDLIWNYVVNNYMLGQDYMAFDLLHWNGDTTNLPAKWHQNYLKDLYRDNKLATPGAITVDGTPIDLTKIKTSAYVQAGREDHIAPLDSVWKLTQHLSGPVKFLLAGSGHIAGVVNPPVAGKYQYWTNDKAVRSLEDFVAGAKETPGSWWPDWFGWLEAQSAAKVPAKKARKPGKGKLEAIESAPGRYVKSR